VCAKSDQQWPQLYYQVLYVTGVTIEQDTGYAESERKLRERSWYRRQNPERESEVDWLFEV
jgi:hypothetical protein